MNLQQLSIILISIVLIAGCTQEPPTGEIIANETTEIIETCKPNWDCTFWSDCIRTGSETGIQNRTCIDNNNCDITVNKPLESRDCGMPGIALKEPSEMILQISDLSGENWTINEEYTRSRQDVSQVERDLGFKTGYYTNYFSQYMEENDTKRAQVYQFISLYPLVNSAINMTYSFEAAKENYRVGLLYEDTNKRITSISKLNNPFIGDQSIAYNVTVISDVVGSEENIYTIAFTKWDIAEVITVEGINYELLIGLAKKAEEKIA